MFGSGKENVFSRDNLVQIHLLDSVAVLPNGGNRRISLETGRSALRFTQSRAGSKDPRPRHGKRVLDPYRLPQIHQLTGWKWLNTPFLVNGDIQAYLLRPWVRSAGSRLQADAPLLRGSHFGQKRVIQAT